MPAVMQLRLHFARFIYKMITSVPGEWKPYVCGWPREARKHNFSSWSKSSMRELLNAGHFHIFVVFHKEWNDCKSAVLPVTSRTATVTESGELSMADVLTWVRKRRTVKTWASHELWPRPSCSKGGYGSLLASSPFMVSEVSRSRKKARLRNFPRPSHLHSHSHIQ